MGNLYVKSPYCTLPEHKKRKYVCPYKDSEVKLLKQQVHLFFEKGRSSALPVIFSIINRDRTGFITAENLYDYLRIFPDNREMTDKYFDAIVDDTMQKGDKDQDGKLSYHEFINMMQEQRDYRNRVNQRDAELRKSV